MPISAESRRRIELMVDAGFVDSVTNALAYAARLMGEQEVVYVSNGPAFPVKGVSYVKRANPELSTVAYDHARKEFVWQFYPS